MATTSSGVSGVQGEHRQRASASLRPSVRRHHGRQQRTTCACANRSSIRCTTPSSLGVRITARSLHHLLQTRVQVGVVVARAKQRLRSRICSLTGLTWSGQRGRETMGRLPGRSMPSANAPPSTAKPCRRLVSVKRQKIALLALQHAARLAPVRHIGVLLLETAWPPAAGLRWQTPGSCRTRARNCCAISAAIGASDAARCG